MIIISHRANLDGPSYLENNPKQITKVINLGFDVEIDVWYKNRKFYLGHNKHKYKIDLSFLRNNNIWCHAKNLDALNKMLNDGAIHCFWHQNDDFALTSESVIWTYSGKDVCENSVLVLKGEEKIKNKRIYGVCTDFPLIYTDGKQTY